MYKTRKASILILTFLLFTNSKLNAQDFAIAGIGYSYFGSAQVIEGNLTNAEIQIEELSAFINIPIKLKAEGNVLIHGIHYLRISPESSLNTQTDFGDLHRISYRLRWIKSLSNQWKLSLTAEPTLSSTLDRGSIETDDFVFQSSLIFLKQTSKSSRIGFGLNYSTQFGSPLPIPLFIYSRTYINGKLQLLLPSKASYHWQLGKFEFGPQLDIDGSRFGADLPVIQSNELSERIELINYSRVSIGTSVRARLNRWIVTELYGGHTLTRNYRVFDELDNSQSYEMNNSFFAELSISISPLNNKK